MRTSHALVEDFKSIVESWGCWSVTTLYIALLVAPTFRVADACESVSLQYKVVCVAKKLGNMLDWLRRHTHPEEASMAVNRRDKCFLVRNASAVVYVSHRLAVHVM